MFEFITISNGVAVVQHAPSGHVYRFRPVHPGLWCTLTLHKVDEGVLPEPGSDALAEGARIFAEAFASSVCHASTDLPFTAQPPPEESRWTSRLAPKWLLS